jgi:Fic family protein
LGVPTLHLSRTIESTKETYIDLLTAVRRRGAWNEWLEYFVDVVNQESVRSIRLITDMNRILENTLPVLAGTRGDLAERALISIITEPVFSISSLARSLEIQFNSAKRIVQLLERVGLVQQANAGNRNRRYAALEVVEAYERE